MLPDLERNIYVDLARARGALPTPASRSPPPTAFTFSSSVAAAPGGVFWRQVPTFPPLGSAELPGMPKEEEEEGEGEGEGGGRRGRRGRGRGKQCRLAPMSAGRRGGLSRRGCTSSAAQVPAAALPRPRAAAPGFPRVSALIPRAATQVPRVRAREGNGGDAGSPATVT